MGNNFISTGNRKNEKGSFLSDISRSPQTVLSADEKGESPYLALIETVQRYYKLLLEVEIKLDEEKERRNQITSQFEGFLVEMLEVIDFWEGIIGFVDDSNCSADKDIRKLIDNFLQGVKLLQKKLFARGIESFEPKAGESFMPGRHFCIKTEECETLPEDVISKVVKRGYTWEGRLLRPAHVITVKNQRG